jgi:hypothetical protein
MKVPMRDLCRMGRRSLAALVFLGLGSLAAGGCGADHVAAGGGATGSAGGAVGSSGGTGGSASGAGGAGAVGLETAGLQFNGTISFFRVLP